MSFGDPAILLSVNGGAQQRFHKGEKAGAFEIVGFDNEKITLRWNDKTIERKLSELKPKEAEQPAPMRGAYQATAPAPLAGGPVVKSVGGGPAASDPDKNKPDPVMGIDRGDGFYGCQMNDPTPSGTVVAGYRKVVSQTLMGKACYWEKVK
jgi:hypothetical protein